MEGIPTQENGLGAARVEVSKSRRWLITAGVMTGMAIAALEATVVGTAMPTVIASLGGIAEYSWVFSAYLVTSTVTVPVWGKLSDLYGRRLMYQLGIGVFLLGTALSGFSTSMTQLIIFRAIQGLGAGALVPLGMTIIGDTFTLKERAKMQALFSGVWGLSSVIGPMVGGFITDQISWRWVFFINLPVGILAAIIIGIALKEPKRTEKPSIDYLGAMTLMLAISLLMLAMVEGGKSLSTLVAGENLVLIASSLLLLGIFIYVETRAKDPMIPFRLFRNKTISVATFAGFLSGVAMFGGISFIPLFAQGTLGMTATQAGSLLTPLMLSWVSMSIIVGRLMLKIGYRIITILGFLVLSGGFMLLSSFQRTTPVYWLYFDLILVGTGLGLTMLTLLIAVQQSVERSDLGTATSLNQFFRAIGGALGVAVMGAFLTSGLATQLMKMASGSALLTAAQAESLASNPNALIEPSAKASLPAGVLPVLQDAMAAAIHPVFFIVVVVSVLALIASLFMPKLDSHTEPNKACGEKMLMAEQTTINARNEPLVEE
ncbi:MAG: MFS transporter [Acidobacteria bacterium]|nr:MFS transporter [Acidobacteriota bacterium]